MSVVEPENSKKKVMKAGKALVECYDNERDLESEPLDILNNWRLSHSYPLARIREQLEKNAKEADPHSLIGQRIKRVPSIVGKLSRYPQMRLDRMQDLGGCRAIVGDVKKVYEVTNNIKESRFLHELKNEKDYIQFPKESGYRGIHLVYAFKNKKYPKLNGLQIEMQIRTTVQHSWATAVEVVGAFTAQSLKSSLGNECWLEFFKLTSDYFQDLEEGKKFRRAPDDLLELCKKLHVVNFINACAATANHIENNKKDWASYFLMFLNPKEKTIHVTSYSTSNFSQAGEDYLEAEKRSKDIPGSEVALVSTDDLDNLKVAYPNYFADTKTFMNNLSKVLGADILSFSEDS
ncbi:RelA/SpoT domain-containing protein [Vibrio rotiferianus]|uniref:RelA/SpoT domain-containing protein n=1 Tax=Vibrio harveyi group TaxID=717610 RepID=UPI0002C48C97|nr:RelA/SpoT domain-containing protein [Vibrio harveyi]EMR38890.1 hypothetical protein MUQ_02270 [Vibrio harveyi CAIM 1792]